MCETEELRLAECTAIEVKRPPNNSKIVGVSYDRQKGMYYRYYSCIGKYYRQEAPPQTEKTRR